MQYQNPTEFKFLIRLLDTMRPSTLDDWLETLDDTMALETLPDILEMLGTTTASMAELTALRAIVAEYRAGM